MRKRNLIMYGCMVAMSLALMTGCGSSGNGSVSAGNNTSGESSIQNESSSSGSKDSNSNNGSSEDKQGEKPKEDGSKMVQVTKVDGKTITAAVGEDMGGGMGPGNGQPPADGNGQPPADAGGNGDSSDSKPAPPDANGNGDSSDSKQAPPERPDQNFEMKFNATDETITFKITSDTKITTGGRENSKEASADDIKENSVLRVIVNDNNEAESIEIMGGGQ